MSHASASFLHGVQFLFGNDNTNDNSCNGHDKLLAIILNYSLSCI